MNLWTTGEVAKQRGISVRTLRYYDQIKLLKPSFRDENGKRFYAEEDLIKLEKIIILKKLSLPLDDIHEVLEKLTYKQILMSHYNYLREQQAKLEMSISHTTSLIHMLDLNEQLSWEKISTIVYHAEENNNKKWLDYFEKDEQEFLQRTMPKLNNHNEQTQAYMSFLHRIEWCIKHDIAPESEEALQIVSTLMAFAQDDFQGNTTLMDKFWEIRKLPVEDTGLFPISDEVLSFVERAMDHLEREEDLY